MNYIQLRAVVQTYAQDFEASFVDNIDNFIQLSESRILLKVHLPKFRKDVTATLVPNEPLLTVPTDFLSPDSIALQTVDGLSFPTNKDPEFLIECYPDPTVTGLPRFYSFVNETSLKFGPPPDLPYPVFMGYFYQPPSITDTGTNWVGDHFAHALVSGSLLEAAKYQKAEDALFMRWQQAFEADLAMDKDEYAKGRAKKDTYQEPDARAQV